MPKIDKIFTLEITVEQFLNACSSTELQEVEMLLSSNRYQTIMKFGRAVKDLENKVLDKECPNCSAHWTMQERNEKRCFTCEWQEDEQSS